MQRFINAAIVGIVLGTVVNGVLRTTNRSLDIHIGWPKHPGVS